MRSFPAHGCFRMTDPRGAASPARGGHIPIRRLSARPPGLGVLWFSLACCTRDLDLPVPSSAIRFCSHKYFSRSKPAVPLLLLVQIVLLPNRVPHFRSEVHSRASSS